MLNRIIRNFNLLAGSIRLKSVGFLLVGLIFFSLVINVQAATRSEIRDRGYLIVGVKDNLRPLGFEDSQNQLQGLEIDLARQLAIDLLEDETAIEFQPLLNQDRLAALLSGQVDLVIAHVGLTDARTRVVDFSRPYYLDGTAFISNQPQIQSLGDLQQQTVAVLNRSDTISTVRSLLPSVRLEGVESYEDAKFRLETGQVVAFAADVTVLTGWIQEYPTYHLVPTLISAEALAIAMPKGKQYDKLRQQVDASIDRLRSNGWLRQRIREWGLPLEGFPSLIE